VVSAGWWIAAVLLTPVADRPYIGGSTDNNPLELAFGYNGLGRLFGGDGNLSGGGGGGGGGSSFGGTAGLQRLFSGEFGLEISWLLPAAVVLLAAGIWVTWRGPRTDSARASLIIFGGWLLSTGVTFAYMQGTIHPYYTVALAPAIGALVGIGSVLVWRHRFVATRTAYGVLALTIVVTGGLGFELLRTDSEFHPSVRYLALAAAIAAVLLLAVAAAWSRTGRRVIAAAGVLTAIAVAVPTTAWAVATAATPHTGAIPTAVSGSGSAGFGSGSGAGGFGAPGGGGGAPGGGFGAPGGGGGFGGGGRAGGAGGTGGAGGGASGGASSSSALAKALETTSTRWAAAVEGSNSAASLELASDGKAVMAMGGFTGTDPAPTLAEFAKWADAGDITYYIAGGGRGGGPGGQGTSSQITSWVKSHFKSATIGGETVYLLLEPKS
jgi:hypothetical protein